jgi:hypothetical protein
LAVAIAFLALITGLARAFDWSGWWVVVALVGLAALTFVFTLWRDVIRPAKDEREVEAREHRHASAVEIELSPDDEGVGVWVSNVGIHEIKRIEVLGIPTEGFEDMQLRGPRFQATEHPLVKHIDVIGGDLCFEIEQIDPREGVLIARYYDVTAHPTKIQFEAKWIDHEGRRRGSVGIGDLAGPRNSLQMHSRQQF